MRVVFRWLRLLYRKQAKAVIFLDGHIRNMFNKIRFSDYKFFEILIEFSFSEKNKTVQREKCYIFSSNKEE